ncbi:TenA family protein [Microlunatus soli]|uniref:Thiaminase /4-amino-5-aminomethyl-2-methylpyrimidine deaminase n=1 Tax=Microlunatus soli TaxID=630515 RepID=A0A1H1NNL2_9ACTN|nr:TenA family protein [Microlunatus soli]SDS00558.1 thiaminase /4-amino-5-aminomethyl-2-methylpyrimidine deaminase [Microlunatus soli]
MSLTQQTSAPTGSPTGGFSEDAWQSVGAWFTAITSHPFLTALADGSLPEQVFCRYLIDDAHYLNGYSAALATLSARSDDLDGRVMLARSAASAIEAERSLHRGYLLPRGIDPDAAGAPEPSPTCVGYVEGLRSAAALQPLGVGMAAVLPCFRVYAEVGCWIVNKTDLAGPAVRTSERVDERSDDHPYRDWIGAYSDPAFAEAVRAAEAYTDLLADRAGPTVREAMADAYRRATRWEWMFWNAAWVGESWPTPGTVAQPRSAAEINSR